ncbi:hypothetical protein HDV04_000706 [Boothiomyces sp. JEL0838]|nr:hypothetical protein HDV04_000706 [Boothiomyces sp. JEL0838]
MHLSDIASQIPHQDDDFTREIRSRYNIIPMDTIVKNKVEKELYDIPMTEFQVFDSQDILSGQDHPIIKSPIIEQLVQSPTKSPVNLSLDLQVLSKQPPSPILSLNFCSPTNSPLSIHESPQERIEKSASQNSILISPDGIAVEIKSLNSTVVSSDRRKKSKRKIVISSPDFNGQSPILISQNSLQNSPEIYSSPSPPKRKHRTRELEVSPLLIKNSQESKIKRKLKEISYDLPDSEYEELRELDDFIDFDSPKSQKKIKKFETPVQKHSSSKSKSATISKSTGKKPTSKQSNLPRPDITPATKPITKSFTEPKKGVEKPQIGSDKKKISDILKNFDALLDNTKSKDESDFEDDLGDILKNSKSKSTALSSKSDAAKFLERKDDVYKTKKVSTAYDSLNRYSTAKSVPIDSDSDLDQPVKKKQSRYLGLFADNAKRTVAEKDTPKRSTLNLDDLEKTVVNKSEDTLGLFDDDSDIENNSHTTITNNPSSKPTTGKSKRLSTLFDNNLTRNFSNPPPKKSMWAEYDSDGDFKQKPKFETPVPSKTYYQQKSEQYDYEQDESREPFFDLKRNDNLGALANYFTQFSSEGPKRQAKAIVGKTFHYQKRQTFTNCCCIRGVLSTRSSPGAASLSYKRPCVYWYGENYPYSNLYERNPNATGNLVRDNTHLAEPLGGWFQAFANTPQLADVYTQNQFQIAQQRSWSIYSADSSVNTSLIGSKPYTAVLTNAQILQSFLNPNTPAFVSPTSGSNVAMLGTIPTRYYVDFRNNTFQPVPWYNYTGGSDSALDDTIGNIIQSVIAQIAAIPKSDLQSSDLATKLALLQKINGYLNVLPHGAIYFNTIDHTNKKYSWNYHYGTDIRLTSSSTFPAPGPRLIYQQTQLDNAILRNMDTKFANAQITQGLRILPQVGTTKIDLPFGSLIGAILYPFGVSFLLPIFAITLVQEKESRILGYKFAQLLRDDNEIAVAVRYLFVEIFVFFGLAAYLDAIFPTEFGISKPWHFIFTEPMQRFKKNPNLKVSHEALAQVTLNVDEIKFEDQDVKDERNRILDPSFKPEDHLLVLRNMRKIYAGRGGAGPKLAVKDATFAVEQGVTFGLLGPNGAGKSTLISILTGLYSATAGVATLAGFDIRNETSEVYKRIGICPQFDILWEDLTVQEHLYFYARLKGVDKADEDRAVKEALEEVALTGFKDNLSKALSGGQKRRISIAIALLGTPSVIFLDEPTTGLDPEVRRLIWDIVNAARTGKTIVLTTHSMEEAEALCQRIAIMAKGTLRCIANPTRLKELYGSGFRIFANMQEENTAAASKFIESILPEGWTKVDSFATSITYEFPAKKGAVASLFETIEKKKKEVGILDYGIGQTTLEEVFVKLINEADASAEY